MSEQQSRSRADFLRADFDESMRLAAVMVDWRAIAAGAVLAGLTALVGAIAMIYPLVWLVFLVVIGANVAFGVSRRRVTRLAGEKMVALVDAGSNREWDRTGMADLPHHYQYPEDVSSPAGLERLLKIPPDDVRAQQAAARPVVIGVWLSVALMFIAVASAIFAIFWLFGNDDLPRTALVAGVVFASLLTAVVVASDVQRFMGYSRRVSQAVVSLAVAELPRLWAIDNSFDGLVVRSTPTGYVLDVTKMSVPPTPSKLSPNPRRVALALAILTCVFGLVAVVIGVVLGLGLA